MAQTSTGMARARNVLTFPKVEAELCLPLSLCSILHASLPFMALTGGSLQHWEELPLILGGHLVSCVEKRRGGGSLRGKSFRLHPLCLGIQDRECWFITESLYFVA